MADNIQWTFQGNFDEARRDIEQVKTKILKMIGEFVESETKSRCPVDTGNLRDRYTHKVQGSEYVIIGTNVDYAEHVEFGTSRQRPQPHLRPAVNNNKARIQRLVDDIGSR